MEKNDNQLKELQDVELNILKEFIRVCDKLNLNYYLVGGTLIGAIRHHGFIPWDDDIDVCMFRKDYEIFLKEGQNHLDKKYFLQTYRTDKDYVQCFAKIRDNETTFLEESVKDYDMNHGIFIDIFPLDNYYHYNKIKTKMIRYILFDKKPSDVKNILKKILILISRKVYGSKTKIELCEKLEKIFTKSNNRTCKKVITYCGFWGDKKESHFKENYSDFKLVDFEDIKAKVPVGYDQCLRDTYGDYMQLPPIEKRVSHHFSEIIDTKKSYKEYIKLDNKN